MKDNPISYCILWNFSGYFCVILKYYIVFFSITMEIITFKVDEQLSKAMEKAMKPLYATKTEFIREAIRKHIRELEKEEAKRELYKLFGSAKTKTSMAELRRIREEVSKELLEELKQSESTNMRKH